MAVGRYQPASRRIPGGLFLREGVMTRGKLALIWAVAAAIACAGEAEVTREDWESSMLWAKVSVEQGTWEEAVPCSRPPPKMPPTARAA